VPPPPPPRGPLLWPWLLALLLLVAGGLVAWYLLTRDNDNGRKPSAAVIVPNVVGQKQSAAVARVNRAGLTARVLSKPSKLARSTVFAEQPGPGSRVSRGSVVTLSVSAAQTVLVPNVVGKRAAVAINTLSDHGFEVQTASVVSRQAAGTVLSQSPDAGARVAKGSTVVIRVSRGLGLVRVPDVTGQMRAEAEATVRAAGLVPQVVSVPSTAFKGTVLAQSPRSGTRVRSGSKVRLNVSSGQSSGVAPPPPPPQPPPPPAPATAMVPDVTGQSQEVAQRQLNAAGFKSGVVYVPSTTDPEGTVVSQAPQAGTTQKRGTRIQLNVSLGPNPGAQKAVPDVLADDPQAATTKLTGAGFKVQRLTQNISDRSQNGVVVDEQPAGGRNAPARP
jgi:serine/threonine-protein kinase